MIELTKKAAQMMRTAVLEAPTLEVLGFGKVTVDSGIITVTDITIPPQEVGAVHTDLENDDLAGWLTSLAQNGMVLAEWPLWWHSHCSMPVSPSAQDAKTLALLVDSVPNLGWFAGIVTNIRGEYHGWINTTHPVDLDATLDVSVDDPVPTSIITAVKDMMKEVRKAPPVAFGPPGRGYPRQGPVGAVQVPTGLPNMVAHGDAAAWEKWTKRFPADANRRLPDMTLGALNGLREVFGADVIDALLEREDELIAVMGTGALNQVGQEMMRRNTVGRGGKKR